MKFNIIKYVTLAFIALIFATSCKEEKVATDYYGTIKKFQTEVNLQLDSIENAKSEQKILEFKTNILSISEAAEKKMGELGSYNGNDAYKDKAEEYAKLMQSFFKEKDIDVILKETIIGNPKKLSQKQIDFINEKFFEINQLEEDLEEERIKFSKENEKELRGKAE